MRRLELARGLRGGGGGGGRERRGRRGGGGGGSNRPYGPSDPSLPIIKGEIKPEHLSIWDGNPLTCSVMSLDFRGNGNTKLDQSMEYKRVITAILGRSCVQGGSGHLCAVNQGFKSAKICFD